MPTLLSRRDEPNPARGVEGNARVDRRTKNLTKRLGVGDIAVIDHEDLDRVAAEALLACRPAAVVNAARSSSGRYPNVGPGILVEGGIPLIDDAGPGVMEIPDRTPLRLEGARVVRAKDGAEIATGTLVTGDVIEGWMSSAREGLSEQIESFAENTMAYLREERDLLLDGVGVPDITTKLDGRHALIVVRGYSYKEDLEALAHYIREFRPVLIGVDGGADALVAAGYTPDLIVGDMDSVSDGALTSGAEIIVHAYRDGNAPGAARVRDLGVEPIIFPAMGTSEDVAMLLADDKGATLIVAVGTHVTLVEFLDKGRPGMASTFLTRLRVGTKLVDAKGVSNLYRASVPTTSLILMIAMGVLALGAALLSTDGGRALVQVMLASFDDLWTNVRGVLE